MRPSTSQRLASAPVDQTGPLSESVGPRPSANLLVRLPPAPSLFGQAHLTAIFIGSSLLRQGHFCAHFIRRRKVEALIR